jgi:glycosyltransferase involved in cell wall biosynthesis
MRERAAELTSLPAEPLVSILTTSFNHSRWIGDTIRSVASQDYPALEHIIVDDGSTDNSLEKIRAAQPRSGQVMVTPHVGQARALNEAFRVSRGSIIGWLSSDDVYFSAGVVRRAVSEFQRHPKAGAIYGHSVLIDAAGKILRTSWAPPRPRLWNRAFRVMFVQPSVFVRREAVGETFVDPSLDIAMDSDLFHRIASRHELARLPMIVAAERHHVSRKTYTMGEVQRYEDELVSARWSSAAASHRRDMMSRLIYRLLGATLVPSACWTELAFSGGSDGIGAVLWRQLFVRRRDMLFEPDLTAEQTGTR